MQVIASRGNGLLSLQPVEQPSEEGGAGVLLVVGGMVPLPKQDCSPTRRTAPGPRSTPSSARDVHQQGV
jgi:hypothetical protein